MGERVWLKYVANSEVAKATQKSSGSVTKLSFTSHPFGLRG